MDHGCRALVKGLSSGRVSADRWKKCGKHNWCWDGKGLSKGKTISVSFHATSVPEEMLFRGRNAAILR